MHSLIRQSVLVPYIVEDVFFRASPAANPRLTNTVVQVAKCESWSSFREILVANANSLLLRHLPRYRCCQRRRKGGQKLGFDERERERETGTV